MNKMWSSRSFRYRSYSVFKTALLIALFRSVYIYIYIYIYIYVCVCVCVRVCVCHESGSWSAQVAHHIDTCSTLRLHVTHGLHFPSTIALITQLSPITHCTNHTADCTDHTLYISLGLPLSLTAYISECFPCVFSCWLPGPFTLIWPFAACLFDPACLLDILSVCRLPRPLRCPWLCISLAFVTLVTVD